MSTEVILQFLLAIGLGALIGMERGIRVSTIQRKKVLEGFGEMRTYGLISFLGAFVTYLSIQIQSISFILIGAIFVMILIVAYYMYGMYKYKHVGSTTEMSGIITFFLGVAVALGNTKLAIITTIFLTFLLSSKSLIEGFTDKISQEELFNTLKFAVISIVMLPLLPNEKYSLGDLLSFAGYDGTFSSGIMNADFLNPYGIWFFVVLMAGISYAGYIMSKLIGEKGSIIASGAIGGLISSTAVTAAMTESSKLDTKNRNLYVVSTLLASTIMFIRVIIIVLFFNINMIHGILIPSIAMFLGLFIYMIYFYVKDTNNKKVKAKKEKEFSSPFSIGPALKFAAFVVFIKFVSAIGGLYKDVWGDYFFYVLGVISGLADVDAISQTMAVDAKDGKIGVSIAAITIIIGIISNNFVKGGIALKFGDKKFGWAVMMGFIVSMLMGIVGIVVMKMFS